MSTSPRVAPGLLTAAAWDALRAADEVYASDDHPALAALDAAGVAVTRVPIGPHDATAADLVRRTDGRTTVWLADPEGDPDFANALAAQVVDAHVDLELVAGSYDLPGAHLLDLVEVMDRLRSPGGCPWDAEQTHVSLLPYLIEEAYEVVEAVESGDAAHLREELGDLLLQVVFHARIAAQDGGFAIDDVADGIVAKLIARHPHVFGDAEVPAEVAELTTSWEAAKAREKGRTELDEGIPAQLPALAYAAKLLGRAAALHEADLPDAPLGGQPTDELIGAALLGIVGAAVRAGVDPEGALRRATRAHGASLRG